MKIVLSLLLSVFSLNSFALSVDKDNFIIGELKLGSTFSEQRVFSLRLTNDSSGLAENITVNKVGAEEATEIYSILRNTCSSLNEDQFCEVLLKAKGIREGDLQNPSKISSAGEKNIILRFSSSKGDVDVNISSEINNIVEKQLAYPLKITRNETSDQKHDIYFDERKISQVEIVCPAKTGDTAGEAYCSSLGSLYSAKDCEVFGNNVVEGERRCGLVLQVMADQLDNLYELKLSYAKNDHKRNYYGFKDFNGNRNLNHPTVNETMYLYDFISKGSTSNSEVQFSGVQNLVHNGTVITTEMHQSAGGVYEATNHCDSVADSQMCMVRFLGDTTLNGLHIPQTRKKGFVLYVDGDLTINGTLSMSSRGASAAGQNLYLLAGYSISAVGANGGARVTAGAGGQHSMNQPRSLWAPIQGADGANGSTGGGMGGGSTAYYDYTATGGAGGKGTSYSGGTGGGGATARSANSSAGNGSNSGGQGGYADGNWDWGAHSGTGNPAGGKRHNDPTYEHIGNSGTGGLLVLYVRGNLIVNGSIQANGVNGAGAGGASGGGSVNVFYSGNYSGSGTLQANGGTGYHGYRAGHGSVRVEQIALD